MKIVPNKTLYALVAMFSGVSAFAGPGNQAPPQPGLPPPPGLPIDGSIVMLFVAAIAFGLYKIYQAKLNKKTPA
jgi:hypothetical protein